MSLTLTSLPEEILERIFSFVLEPRTSSPDVSPVVLKTSFTRSHSAPFPSSASRGSATSNKIRPADFPAFSRPPVHRYTPLLTCTLFTRIGEPLLYFFIHVKSRAQCSQLVYTLRGRPDLARCVRALSIDGLWGDSNPLLRALRVRGMRLERFDFCITSDHNAPRESTSELDMFCDTLSMLPLFGTVKHLTVRKAANAYLALPAPNSTLECLSRVIPEWRSLESVKIGFRLPSGPRSDASPAPAPASDMSGVRHFVAALACAPALRVVHAELPAVWNTALLAIAGNPALRAIRLSPAPSAAGAHAFLAEARRHARLAELIERGTPTPAPAARTGRALSRVEHAGTPSRSGSRGRTRANTTVGVGTPSVVFPSAPVPPPAPAASPSSASVSSNPTGGPSRRSSQRRTGRRQSKASRRISAV
ncbi:uncharacterized protein PHACADRAFT_147594 [Phanerochaete carnosa HHB-10118-sp]|uniref:Uncharacterized protein n=1 Tax=Phanerochaete carnosa (strain HHB-10118-sp) TaxID=650164 RepID=K5W2T4_PHACS|nr:uncharacterized protein PHACADRAFT_147594 [Phanerochaete carnosa HHB-10118-sp]EKM53239.1 hypothetical protein PHACADRAFT_147594 [Phanerochaete carnosa HHB-10118-sp]